VTAAQFAHAQVVLGKLRDFVDRRVDHVVRSRVQGEGGQTNSLTPVSFLHGSAEDLDWPEVGWPNQAKER